MLRRGPEINSRHVSFPNYVSVTKNNANSFGVTTCVGVVKPFLCLCFAFIFVRAILCLKWNVSVVLVRGGGSGLKNQMQLRFVAVSAPAAITSNHGPTNHLL